MIKLTMNGKEKELEHPMGLNSYLESLDLIGKSIAVGYNGTVLRKEEFDSITLSEGDQVEIVRAVGGG